MTHEELLAKLKFNKCEICNGTGSRISGFYHSPVDNSLRTNTLPCDNCNGLGRIQAIEKELK